MTRFAGPLLACLHCRRSSAQVGFYSHQTGVCIRKNASGLLLDDLRRPGRILVLLIALCSEPLGVSEKEWSLFPTCVFRAMVVLVCPAALLPCCWAVVLLCASARINLAFDDRLSRIWWKTDKAETFALAA